MQFLTKPVLVLSAVVASLLSGRTLAQSTQIRSAVEDDLPSICSWSALDFSDALAIWGASNNFAERMLPGRHSVMNSINSISKEGNSTKSIDKPHSRKKRVLLIDHGKQLSIGLQVSFNVPLMLVYKSKFRLQTNIKYKVKITEKAERRAFETSVRPFVEGVDSVLKMAGIDTTVCTRRLVCDLASGARVKLQGIIGEVSLIMLEHMVDSIYIEASSSDDLEEDSYLKAALRGRGGQECSEVYPSCPVSIINLFQNSI